MNRTRSKAEAVAKEIRTRYPAVKVALNYPPKTVGLVLNATSLGLKPADPLPFDEKFFSFGQANAVYDMIYRPAETPLHGYKKVQQMVFCGIYPADGAKYLPVQAGVVRADGQAPSSMEATALAVLALRDDGALGLDDPLTRFLPEAGTAAPEGAAGFGSVTPEG